MRPIFLLPRCLLLVVGAVAFLPARAEACPGDEVHVTVVSILATDKDKKVDKKLSSLAKCIQTKRPELTGFIIGSQSCTSVEVGKAEEFEFAENDKRKIIVTVRHGCDEEKKVGLTIQVPCCAKIDYKTSCGKFFPVETCYKTKDGKCVFIAIRVEPCKGK